MAPTDINILSAGAVAPGLKKISAAFQRETTQHVNLTFATAPVIVERLRHSARIDIVIAPSAALDDLARSGKISSLGRVLLGRIGVGVMVRAGVPQPPIATVEQLKKSLLVATSAVFNRASTGTYLENLFQRLRMVRNSSANRSAILISPPCLITSAAAQTERSASARLRLSPKTLPLA